MSGTVASATSKQSRIDVASEWSVDAPVMAGVSSGAVQQAPIVITGPTNRKIPNQTRVPYPCATSATMPKLESSRLSSTAHPAIVACSRGLSEPPARSRHHASSRSLMPCRMPTPVWAMVTNSTIT